MCSFKFSIVRIRCGTGLKKYSSFDVYFHFFFFLWSLKIKPREKHHKENGSKRGA